MVPPACRFCKEPDDVHTVCNCQDLNKYAHIPCLESWQAIHKVDTCVLCGGTFDYDICAGCEVCLWKFAHVLIAVLFIGIILLIFIREILN